MRFFPQLCDVRSHSLFIAPVLFLFGLVLTRADFFSVIPGVVGVTLIFAGMAPWKKVSFRREDGRQLLFSGIGLMVLLSIGLVSFFMGLAFGVLLSRIQTRRNLVLRSLIRGLVLGLAFSLGLRIGDGPTFLFIFGVQVTMLGMALSLLNVLVRSEIMELRILDRVVGEVYVRIFISSILLFAVVFSPLTGVFFEIADNFLFLTLLGGVSLLYAAVRLVYRAVPPGEISKLVLLGAAFYIFAHITVLI